MAGPSPEIRAGIVPYANEAALPTTAFDAFKDLVRYAATLQPRAQVEEFIKGMDSFRIIEAARGTVNPPLTNLERIMFYTMEYCTNKGLANTGFAVMGAIEAVRQEVAEGDFFIGQEGPKPTT